MCNSFCGFFPSFTQTAVCYWLLINTGQTELADSAQGTALSQIKTIHVVIYITIDKKSRLQLITKSLVRMM